MSLHLIALHCTLLHFMSLDVTSCHFFICRFELNIPFLHYIYTFFTLLFHFCTSCTLVVLVFSFPCGAHVGIIFNTPFYTKSTHTPRLIFTDLQRFYTFFTHVLHLCTSCYTKQNVTLRKYRNPSNFFEIFRISSPILVNSPTGHRH